MYRLVSKLKSPLHVRSNRWFYLIILLATSPIWGQANKFIGAHFDGNNVYLEIKNELLDTPILFVRHDIGNHQVIWSKQSDYLLLTIAPIQSSSGVIIPVHHNYKNSSNIIGRFAIIKDKSNSNISYIDVTELFFSSEINWNVQTLDRALLDKSFVKGIHFLENETIITTVQTTQHKDIKKTTDVNFSFYKLPDLMTSRLYDHRMGFAVEDEYDIINEFPVSSKANIMRWRLKKNNNFNLLSKPIKPIVFYFDPEMPSHYKPYVKAGVLEWLPTFEAAGFKNAVEVRDLPNVDSLWNRNTVNYSIIRWKNFANIRGGEFRGGGTVNRIVDFRSGEILKSDILLNWSDVTFSDNYLVRCAPLDIRAQQYPFSDELIGELLQSLTAHESGHAFGIKDADFGEYAYPFEKLRDKKWLQDMGHTPSIMSYARHNYIVQPEDNIPPHLLIQKVGPADYYQIKWGYKIFTENAISNLENLVLEQDSTAWYRYHNHYTKTIGPGNTNEVVESNDPIQSTRLGLKNIKRVLELLPEINRSQKDNAFLERLHHKTLELWYHQMSQVMSLIGGYAIQYKSGAQFGPVYTPIPRDIQMDAIDFLLQNAFDVPQWLSNPSFLSKVQYSTDSDILMNYQLKLISELIEPYRMKRLEEMEKSKAYDGIIKEFLSAISNDLFKELILDKISIDNRKQELQTAYINILHKSIVQKRDYVYIGMGNSYGLFNGYIKGMYAGELLILSQRLLESSSNVDDMTILGHIKLCIEKSKLTN